MTPSSGKKLLLPSSTSYPANSRYSIAFSVNPVGKFCMGSDIEVEFK